MPTKTKIEWADYVSNPLKAKYQEKRGHMCVKVSEGCKHCWASGMNVRLGTGLEYAVENLLRATPFWDDDEAKRLLKFKPRGPFKNGRSRPLVFLNDMTDVGGGWWREEWLLNLRGIVSFREDVEFVFLTKRPARMRQLFLGTAILPNVILGASVENRQRAMELWYPMNALAKAGWRMMVSFEPCLGRVEWEDWSFLDWLVCGGESGSQARPMASAWARGARDFCARNKIPFFFKQWGEWGSVTDLTMRGMVTFKTRPVSVEGEMMAKVGRGYTGHALDGEVWRQVPGQEA